MFIGEEASRSRAKDEGRRGQDERKLRNVSARPEQLQRQVHGGHDRSVRALPTYGGPTTAVLQRHVVRGAKVPQRVSRSRLAANLRRVLPHGKQRRPREGLEVVGQHARRQHGHELADLRGE